MSSITSLGIVLPGGTGSTTNGLGNRSVWGEITLFEPPDGSPGIAAEVPELSLQDLGVSVKSYLDRTTMLALAAASMALGNRRGEDIGLSYASRWGCLASMNLFYAKVRTRPRVAPPLPFSHSYINSTAAVTAIEFGLKGFHAVYSRGRSCALDALAAAEEATAPGAPVLVIASDSLGPERYSFYLSEKQLAPGPVPLEDRFIPSEGAVALLVEESPGKSRMSAWCKPGPVKKGMLKDTLEASLGRLPRRVYTDAATLSEAGEYERALGEREYVHPGLFLGNAEAVLPLAGAALAAEAGVPALCIAGGVGEPTAVLIEPEDER